MGFTNIFSKLTKEQINFHKNFLKWEQNNITQSVHKEFMKDIISDYKYYYELVEKNNDDSSKKILNDFQTTLTNIMNNWNFHYFHIPLKSFYDSVKVSDKDSQEFQNYFKAYAKYDKNPKDPNLRRKVEKEQKKLEPFVKNISKVSYLHIQ